MSSVMTPRRRWLGRTPTHVTPAARTTLPGIVSSKGHEAVVPIGRPSSQAASTRSGGIIAA